MYYLLPFRFERFEDQELLVNEVGDYLFCPQGTAARIVNRELTKDEELYHDLLANFFISSTPIPPAIDVLATRLRTKKAFLDTFTALHIFVLTLRCNQNCVYCQATSQQECAHGKDMQLPDLLKAVELMFRSPSEHLTMEFQGGEPSLVPHLVRVAIEKADEINQSAHKTLTYVLCTNSVNLTDEMLSLCKQYNILISTSLDGPRALHNSNRGKIDSYEKVVAGIARARQTLGEDKVSALMTTSVPALDYPKEIVDAYRENGFRSIFIRALNPYGLATENNDREAYTTRFIEFYKQMLDYIIEINKSDELFVEEFTRLILQKILTPFPIGFVDLQSPAGIVNSVVVYNYDGFVYASDESRMLAEAGDYTFRLGKISDSYESLFYGKKAQHFADCWATETIAGCSDCPLQSYCGADPVRNYSTQGFVYGHRPTSLLCRKYKAIIEHILSLLKNRSDEVMPIFTNWIKGRNA